MSEALEKRHLLTTIFGGESFTFESFDFGEIDEDGELTTFPVVVQVQGNDETEVRLIGVGQGPGGWSYGDISGEISSPDPTRNGPTRGGVGGLLGSTVLLPDQFAFLDELGDLQRFNLTDYIGSIIPSLAGPVLLATQDLIQFSEIATDSAGNNYGMQLVDVQLGDIVLRQLQIAQFNTDLSDFDPDGVSDMRNPGGSGLSERTNVGDALFLGDIIENLLDAVRAVEPLFPPEDPEDPLADRDFVVDFFGADFAPGDDNTLYVGANITVQRQTTIGSPQITDIDVPFIFAVDLSTLTPGGANVQVIARDFWGDAQSLDAQTVAQGVTAFAMQDSNTLAIFGEFTERFDEGTQQQNLQSNSGLLVVDISSTQVSQLVDIDNVIPVALNGEAIERLEALEYRPRTADFDPPNELGRLYALTELSDNPQEDPQLLIQFGTTGQFGNLTVIGGLADVGGSPAGGNLLSLSWDPTTENPFTPELSGAFVSFDATTDQFLKLDQRPRGVTSSSLALYNIQVKNGDENTRITVWALDDNGLPITLEGSHFALATVFNQEAGEVELVESPDGSGPLYLGLKIVDEDVPFVFTLDSVDPANISEGSPEYDGKLYNGLIRPGLYTQNSSLGGFFWAGSVTGNVRIEGSLGEFYAGLIVTGDTGLTGAHEPDNFAVFGDAGNIVSATSIGSEKVAGNAPLLDGEGVDLLYSTRADFAIGGRVNSIRAAGAIAAGMDIRGDDPPANADLSGTFYKRLPAGAIREVERQGVDDVADSLFIGGTPRIAQINNDSFATYEPIGTLGDGTRLINGLISGDPTNAGADDSVDYYGLGVMAGDEFIVRLSSVGGSPTSFLQIGVFDPDGRLIATDFEDNVNVRNAVHNQPIRIKAKTAGVYRIAIATLDDADFNEAGGEFANQLFTTEPYTIAIRNAGNITAGGIKADGLIYSEAGNVNGSDFVHVLRGDLGVIESETGTILAFQAPGAIRAATGNIRQISGASIGWSSEDPVGAGFVSGRAPKGSIGALRATGTTGNYAGDIFFNWTGVFDADNLPLVSQAIGDDIQVIRAARDVLGNFIVGRGIGSIVAGRHFGAPVYALEGGSGNIGGSGQGGTGAIFANVDDIGNDGFVDMLSIGGNLGIDTLTGQPVGGPAIDVGTSGNFRYFDVTAGGQIVRDPLFGTRRFEPFEQLQPGQSFTFTEDSGTSVTLNPIAGEDPDPTDPNSNPQATLAVLTYPTRSGGSILVTVNTTNGLEVVNNSRGPGSTVELGNIRTAGSGRAVLRAIDPNIPDGEPELVLGGTFFNPNDPLNINDPFQDIFLRFDGPGNVDVFSIDATNQGNAGGKLTEVINNTNGEILDVTAASIGTIRAERVGVAITRGEADIAAAQNRSSFYPFNTQPYLIGVDGSIINLEAEEMGNVFAGIAQGFNITGEGGDGGAGGGGGGGAGGGGGGAGGGGGGAGGGGGGGPAGIIDGGDDGTGGSTGGSGNNGDAGDGTGGGLDPGPQAIGDAGDGIGGIDAGGTGGIGGIGTERVGELPGIIGNVRPNIDGQFNSERHEGIVGPIVAATPDSDEVFGEITFVDIGEGLQSSGSGNVGLSGIYAEGFIVDLVGNNGADIRGDVVAAEINSIRLNGGSIVGADILALPVRGGGSVANSDFSTTREFDFLSPASSGGYIYFEGGGEDSSTVFYEIDDVFVTGGGGILGSRVEGADILNVRVSGGFGIINSAITTVVEGDVALVEGDGLGLRGVLIGLGRDVGTVRAIGDAGLLNINDFSGTVDFSGEGLEFDPYSDRWLSPANDLRRALGLPSDINPRRSRVTNSGLIENTRVSGSRNINLVEAVVIRNNPVALNPVGNFEQIGESFGAGNALSPDFGTSIDFGQTINRINARSTYGLRVEAGDLDRFFAERDLFNTQVRISGEIGEIIAGRLIWKDTSLRADGPDGFFNYVEAEDIYGFVSGDVGIGTVFARRDLDAPTDDPAVATVSTATVRALSRIDEIIVGRHIRTGAYIRATQAIGLLDVGGDIKSGAVVHAVQIEDLQVDGNIFGDIVLSA